MLSSFFLEGLREVRFALDSSLSISHPVPNIERCVLSIDRKSSFKTTHADYN